MRLKTLEIYGFKSFADRTVISFEPGITGIVGPNGSGKSNISDAVRWVLGEQSAKTLRGGKMEDVIFGGTELRRRLSYCEVILTFDNEDHTLPVDYLEVAVSRRVYRSGESEYAVNRVPCRLKDVVDLFRDTGIGKEGYSLIGQGRIDEILSARSEDRRQIFEEAAGIVKYKVRREETRRRMENTQDNLTRVMDILNEMKTRVDPLREQSETARQYLALRDELKKLEINIFLVRTEKNNERVGNLRQNLEERQQRQTEIQNRQDDTLRQRDLTQTRLNELEEKAASVREEVQNCIRDVDARESTEAVLREKIASENREQKRLQEQLDMASRGRGGIEETIAKLDGEIDSRKQQQEEIRAQQDTQDKLLTEKQAALEEKELESEQLREEIIDAMNRISDVRTEQTRLTTMREQIVARLTSLKKDLEQGTGYRSTNDQAVENAQAQLDAEQREKERLEQELQKTSDALEKLGGDADALRISIQQVTSRRQEVQSRLKVLEEMQLDYEGYQNSVRSVLQQARRMQISGVHGVVAGIVQVPEQLERAMEVALGPSLQHVVVEREEDAQQMIEYLKRNRLGRATFLPMSAIHARTLSSSERQYLKMPGCLGVASELIQYDPQYEQIIGNLLGRTVIAENMDAGIPIMRAARQAFRVVTLEGDVMNTGGSMSGGSAQSSITSLLSREREVNEHKNLLGRLDKSLQDLEAESREKNGRRDALKKQHADLYEQLHQQDIACTREEAHLAAAITERQKAATQEERLLEAVGQLENQLVEVERSLENIAGRQSGQDDDRSVKQEQMNALTREIVAKRSELDTLQKKLADTRVSLTACTRDLQMLISDRDRYRKQINDSAKIARESEKELAKSSKQLGQLEKSQKDNQDLLDKAREQLAQKRLAFQEVDQERTNTQKELKESNDTLERIRQEMDEIATQIHKCEMTLSRLENETEILTKKIWDDYELTYEAATVHREPSFRLQDSEKRVNQIRASIKEMGSVNVASIDEYKELMDRYTEMDTQSRDLTKAYEDLKEIVEDLTGQMERQFKAEFTKMNEFFQMTFVKLFGGGQAQLRLEDPSRALECGIEIEAQPPGKKLQMLTLLSGGERALTAIAILFAMLMLKPTPFCFLDEIEAALDDANIDNFAQYLKDFSDKTQFVVVTHRKGTMERCDGMYGVAMEEKGVSKLISVRLSDIEQFQSEPTEEKKKK